MVRRPGEPAPASHGALYPGTSVNSQPPDPARPLRPPPPLALFLLLVAAFLAWRPLPAGDLFWHLNVGRTVLEEGTIPWTDRWSFTSPGKSWTPHALAFDVLLGTVAAIGGLDGVRVLRGLLVALAGWALFALLWEKLRLLPTGRRRLAATGLVALVVLGYLLMSRPRPHWVPLTLVPLAWIWVDRTLRAGAATRVPLPSLPGYLLLVVLWANSHGSCILAVVIPGLAAVLDGQGRTRRHLLAAAALAGVGTLLTVNHFHVWAYLAQLSVQPFGKDLITEWAPPGLGGPHALVQGVLLLLLGLAAWRRPGGPRWERLWALTWVLGYSSHKRQLGFALMAAAVLAAEAWADWRGSRAVPAPAGPDAEEVRRLGGWILGAAGAAFLLLAAGARPLPQPALDQGQLPSVALDPFLETTRHQRFFHRFDWGGYLPWRTRARVRCFIDGRVFLHGARGMYAYRAILEGRPGWEATFRGYDFDAVLLPGDEACTDRILTLGGWRELPPPAEGIRYLVHDPAP